MSDYQNTNTNKNNFSLSTIEKSRNLIGNKKFSLESPYAQTSN